MPFGACVCGGCIATGLVVPGEAVAKGRVSLCDGWMWQRPLWETCIHQFNVSFMLQFHHVHRDKAEELSDWCHLNLLQWFQRSHSLCHQGAVFYSANLSHWNKKCSHHWWFRTLYSRLWPSVSYYFPQVDLISGLVVTVNVIIKMENTNKAHYILRLSNLVCAQNYTRVCSWLLWMRLLRLKSMFIIYCRGVLLKHLHLHNCLFA